MNIYGRNKPYQRKNFFQSLTNYIINAQNTISGEDFNLVEDLNDRTDGSVCNTHLVGSEALTEIIQGQNLHETWWKMSPHKSKFTYHRTQSNIHSSLDTIYVTENINILNSKIMPFQHSDRQALLTEFVLRAWHRGPGFCKLSTSILLHETFQTAFKNFWYDLLWLTFYMVGNTKNIPKNVSNILLCRNAKKHAKQIRGTYTISEFRKDETKPRSKQNKQSTTTPARHSKL